MELHFVASAIVKQILEEKINFQIYSLDYYLINIPLTGQEFADLVRFKTKTNTTTFTNTDMLPLALTFMDEISSMIVERDAGYFLVPATFNLVDDQREYAFSDDQINRMHKLEIKFKTDDSRFPSRYIKDYYGSETESEIVKQYTNIEGEFAHTIRRRAIFLLSGTISGLAAGGRLWYYAYPADFSLTGTANLEVDPSTTTFGFPRPFQELLARRVSIEYKSRNTIKLNKKELDYDKDLKVQLDNITTNDAGGEVIGDFPPAGDLGNDGWNY